MLDRRIVERLSKVLKGKKENKELYYDTDRGRTRDFEELLTNLKSKKVDFEMDKRLVGKFLTEVRS